MTPWLRAPGDATWMEDWLRAGIVRRLGAETEAERSSAFAGISLGFGDFVIALDAAVPAAERMTLAVAVRNALAAGEVGCGGPEALAVLLALARRLRPPGCIAPLLSLWRRRARAETQAGRQLELEVFHTACSLAAGGLPEALHFIDTVHQDPERWHAGFCDLWLLARVRASAEYLRPVRWTQELEQLEVEFRTRMEAGFRMHRFLDEILSAVGPLPEIKRDLEAYAGPGGLPWFFDQLFGWRGPLRIERQDGARVLVRLVAADTRHERRKAQVTLTDEPQTAVGSAIRHLWSDAAQLCDDSRRLMLPAAEAFTILANEAEVSSLAEEALALTARLLGSSRAAGGPP